ncbi:B12-binding domain-containing radical SAM protein [Spirosoma gilvum]
MPVADVVAHLMAMERKNKILLFNPFVTKYKARIPLSILQVAASVYGSYEFVIVDGNREKDSWETIKNYLDTGSFRYFGCTVMPGPQLRQAIPFTKQIKHDYPDIITIWGGYFASNQYKVCIESGYVDFIVNGIGDLAFPALLDALEQNLNLHQVDNLIFREDSKIVVTHKVKTIDMDNLPRLPYQELEKFYPVQSYFGKTHLGRKTSLYHSSFGCPFTCSFCGIVPIFEARWKGFSAERLYQEVKYLKDAYGVDSIEFCDNNFFVSEKRIREFCQLVEPEKINWWGEARIDTVDKFSDDTLALMQKSGCKMIFFGAESGNEDTLKAIDKGGTQTADQMVRFARRMGKFSIIPEYSFVLGFPAETDEAVMKMIDDEIEFIKKIKEANSNTEIIIYVYSPVLTEGSDLYERVKATGFHFPEKLDDWLEQEWKSFDLRKNPLTPWLTAKMINKIRNFEVVLNAYYPTVQDAKLTQNQRNLISRLSSFRYKNNIFSFPLELKFLQKFWLKYRQPEIEGATMQ